jgi:hypothetical protein
MPSGYSPSVSGISGRALKRIIERAGEVDVTAAAVVVVGAIQA